MNNKLICTRGIPASGKSTWAKQQGAAIVYNKDAIRIALHGGVYSKENEIEVVKSEREEVERCLSEGDELVIVDNTHLGEYNKHILFYQELAEKYEYEFEIKDFFCSKEEAILRDSKRPEEERVGARVIGKMCKIQGNGGMPRHPEFKEWGHAGATEPAIIVDIDGTLAFMKGKRGPYDYDKVGLDTLNEHLLTMLNIFRAEGNSIIICSGRKDECKAETIKWLSDNNVPYDKLYMRASDDNRKDAIIKKEIYHKYIEPNYNINAVFDDRNQVVDIWRLELGLPCYQVFYGNF